MTDSDGEDIQQRAIYLFLRLRDAPDDAEALAEREAFLARGPAEREAYAKAQHAWRATKPPRRSGPLKLLFFLTALGSAGYLAAEPLQVFLIADLRSGDAPREGRLASGDSVTLDAASALVDDTTAERRGARLLRGAAYFDVAPMDQPFTVTAGDLAVEVLGTAFEVAHLGDGVAVHVEVGQVEVWIDGAAWTLAPGERLLWPGEGEVSLGNVDPGEVAAWRNDLLVANGLTVRDVAEVLDRRLAGTVLVLDDALAEARVVGTFDLGDPEGALRSLAATQGARVIAAPPLATLLTR
ncbi:MAG: FecR domain-containing protein [Pseudomonadota bacterium]